MDIPVRMGEIYSHHILPFRKGGRNIIYLYKDLEKNIFFLTDYKRVKAKYLFIFSFNRETTPAYMVNNKLWEYYPNLISKTKFIQILGDCFNKTFYDIKESDFEVIIHEEEVYPINRRRKNLCPNRYYYDKNVIEYKMFNQR